MERRSPDWRGCWGAGREVVFSEIHQEWLVLMQEENRLLRKADEEQEHSGRGACQRGVVPLRWRPHPAHYFWLCHHSCEKHFLTI